MNDVPAEVRAEFAADLDKYMGEWTEAMREHFAAVDEEQDDDTPAASPE
jgi:hypothetical protein